MSQILWTEWWLPVVAAPFVGSFLGVVIARLPAGETIIFGRSRCPHCAGVLAPRDLVPLLSWLASGGRCRYCASPLGAFYPGIEAAAIVVAAWAATVVSGWLLWATCLLGWWLLALAVIDQRHRLLPDALTLPLAIAGLGVAYAIDPAMLVDHAIGAISGFLAFLLITVIYRALRGREGLGLGDATLLAAIGAWVSWQGLVGVVLIAAATALAAELLGMLMKRPLSATRRIPFGPYLGLAGWLVWLYGPLVFA